MNLDIDPFAPASSEAIYARIALAGPSGSGKSFTALTLATHLADRVAAIDTERGRLKEHAKPRGKFEFRHFAPIGYDVRELTRLVAAAAHYGYGALVVDSWSHYWEGTDGALEYVDNHGGSNKFASGWKDFRPLENAMLNALLNFPGHVIVTLRTKTAYVVETNDRGKAEPRKVGLQPIQRAGAEYEFSIVGEMDHAHNLQITKSTFEELDGKRIHRPGAELAHKIAEWAAAGEARPDALRYRDKVIDERDPLTYSQLIDLYDEVKNRGMLGAALIDNHGDETTLGSLIVRIGKERKAAAQAQDAVRESVSA
jgi:hypothetical protein